MAFYALLDPAAAGGCGHLADGEELHVTSQPRQLPMTCAAKKGLLHLLAQGDCLARLEPRGPVAAGEAPHLHTSPAGWTIVGWEPVDPVLGPQAEQLRGVMSTFDQLRGNDAVAMAYTGAINAQWAGPDWLPQIHADAARAALEAAGCAGFWWAAFAAPCFMGGELLAVAARDLIGTVPGWTWAAYTELVKPWQTALERWPHPDDPEPSVSPLGRPSP